MILALSSGYLHNGSHVIWKHNVFHLPYPAWLHSQSFTTAAFHSCVNIFILPQLANKFFLNILCSHLLQPYSSAAGYHRCWEKTNETSILRDFSVKKVLKSSSNNFWCNWTQWKVESENKDGTCAFTSWLKYILYVQLCHSIFSGFRDHPLITTKLHTLQVTLHLCVYFKQTNFFFYRILAWKGEHFQ